jgi:SAM-dependent methyltransferase
MKSLKRLLRPLSGTPFHPQFLVFRDRARLTRLIAEDTPGRVLDIGCGNRWVESVLDDATDYVGLDYPGTVALGYDGRADVLGDGMRLPFSSASFDTVVLLDVLEHLPGPTRALSEANRVLRAGGNLIVQVPFLYPLHDEPFDYTRWTWHGLLHLLREEGFETTTVEYHGNPTETASAMTAIALAKTVLDSVRKPRLSIVLTPFLIAAIPLVNILGLLLGTLAPRSSMMPMSYRLVARKP